MRTIRRETRDGSTYTLKRQKTDRRGKQYEYTVEVDGKRIGGGVYTREAGEEMFGELFFSEDSPDPASGSASNSMGFGMGAGSGGGPTLPGFGSDSEDENDEDDNDGDDGPSVVGLGF